MLQSKLIEVQQALDSMAKRVPWKTSGFRYTLCTVPDIEDEGPATSLLKVASDNRVTIHFSNTAGYNNW